MQVFFRVSSFKIGNNYLIRHYYSKQIIFSFSGLRNATRQDQIENFMLELKERTDAFNGEKPENWLQAFNIHKKYLKPICFK